jgi:tungstate transport system ATP-binding protein
VKEAVQDAITADGLVKRYGDRTVVDVESMDVHEGEVLAILGPNGAGKTTLFRMLALLEPPDAGTIRYGGKAVTTRDLSARRKIAAVFQRPLLFQGSVHDNVAYGLKFRHLRRAEVKSKVEHTLDFLGVSRLAEADMRSLSGGELQRVAIARALVLEPEILFLDEPTSNLDVHVRRRFRADLTRIVDRLAATVIIITHEHSEALALAQRVAVINEGRLVQIGTPEEVFTRPQNSFVADFTGAETIWHGVVQTNDRGLCAIQTEAGLLVEAVAPDVKVGARVAVAIRPEDVAIRLLPEDSDGPRSSARNSWCGTVDTATTTGMGMRLAITFDCRPGVVPIFGGEGEVISFITRASAVELGVKPGTKVVASAKASALHVLMED